MVDAIVELERGRDAYAEGAWKQAYESLAEADRAIPLGAEELELLGRAAYMLGRDDDYVSGLERAHHAHLDAGEPLRAARCAFWVGHNMVFRGERGPAQGWFARAQRLVEGEDRDCVERGYLLIPALLEHVFAGEHEVASATAAEVAKVGERFDDPDLVALGVMEQGHAMVRQGNVEQGLRLVDETMVAVTTGELSPIVAGIVYCNTISFCQGVHQLRRAREWTAALTRWCERQPQMVTHWGLCLIHRAEIMELAGAWEAAIEEARRAGEHFRDGVLNQRVRGQAAYRQGEVKRLRGEFAAAEEDYREASRFGREPQPGLALLRLAQGDVDAAAAAIRRAVSEVIQPGRRATLLPAYIEIALAGGELDRARSACRELGEIAAERASEALNAMSAHAAGAVALAGGDAREALGELRGAWRLWQELEAPYQAARVRVLLGSACRALGDEDSATLELESARDVFASLEASPDVARVDSLLASGAPLDAHGLSARELEVLRLVCDGKSNSEIAAALTISEHTVRRHLQNIFAKLGVSSRAAATAFAFQHELL